MRLSTNERVLFNCVNSVAKRIPRMKVRAVLPAA